VRSVMRWTSASTSARRFGSTSHSARIACDRTRACAISVCDQRQCKGRRKCRWIRAASCGGAGRRAAVPYHRRAQRRRVAQLGRISADGRDPPRQAEQIVPAVEVHRQQPILAP
jgi:hypothetical protein